MSKYVDPFRPKPWGRIFTPDAVTPKPDPKPMSDTIDRSEAHARASYPVPSNWIEGAFNRFVSEVLLDRDRVLYKDVNGQDQLTASLPAMRYFTQYYAPTVAGLLVDRGVPGGDGWGELSVRGFERASEVYNRDQRPGPVVVTTPSKINGRLRVVNGRLADDADYVNYQAISAFCLIGHAMQGRREEVLRQLDLAAANGRNAVRVFAMLDPDPRGIFGPIVTFHPDMPGWREAADFVVHEAAGRGLRVQMNIFADTQRIYPNPDDRLRVLRTVLEAYKNEPAVWFRLANEARQNGWREANDVDLLALAASAANILGHVDFAISDYLDGDDEGGTAAQIEGYRTLARFSNILVVHPSRKEDAGRVRPVEHMKGFRDLFGTLGLNITHAGIFDEPIGAASQRQAGRRDNRPAVHAGMAWTAAVLGMGFTYHVIREQDDATPGLAEAAAASRVSVDPAFRFINANLSGSWVGPVGGWSKIRPCNTADAGFAACIGTSNGGGVGPAPGWSSAPLALVDSGDAVAALYAGHRP